MDLDYLKLVQGQVTASQDAVSLFTKVSAQKTVELILYKTFRHVTLQSPPLPEHIMRYLLQT